MPVVNAQRILIPHNQPAIGLIEPTIGRGGAAGINNVVQHLPRIAVGLAGRSSAGGARDHAGGGSPSRYRVTSAMVGIEAVGGVDDLVAEIRVDKRHPIDVAGGAGVVPEIQTAQISVGGINSRGRIGAGGGEIHHSDVARADRTSR